MSLRSYIIATYILHCIKKGQWDVWKKRGLFLEGIKLRNGEKNFNLCLISPSFLPGIYPKRVKIWSCKLMIVSLVLSAVYCLHSILLYFFLVAFVPPRSHRVTWMNLINRRHDFQSYIYSYRYELLLHTFQFCWISVQQKITNSVKTNNMLQEITKIASVGAMNSHLIAKNIGNQFLLKNSQIFKKAPGNSFTTFKEYRENAKTYGPLSASLASRRHLTDLHKF